MAIPRLRCTDYKVLNDEQMYQVHLAVLRVLDEVGVFIEHEEALKIFADSGCRVDGARRDPQQVMRFVRLAIRVLAQDCHAVGSDVASYHRSRCHSGPCRADELYRSRVARYNHRIAESRHKLCPGLQRWCDSMLFQKPLPVHFR
jgi:hypothetical protein